MFNTCEINKATFFEEISACCIVLTLLKLRKILVITHMADMAIIYGVYFWGIPLILFELPDPTKRKLSKIISEHIGDAEKYKQTHPAYGCI